VPLSQLYLSESLIFQMCFVVSVITLSRLVGHQGMSIEKITVALNEIIPIVRIYRQGKKSFNGGASLSFSL
jgi:precorrin-6x reductase